MIAAIIRWSVANRVLVVVAALALAIAGAIAALAPEVVVLGGGVVKPHGYFWQQIEKSAREHSHVTDIDRIEFRAASYSYEAGVVGAALWSREVTAGRATPAP